MPQAKPAALLASLTVFGTAARAAPPPERREALPAPAGFARLWRKEAPLFFDAREPFCRPMVHLQAFGRRHLMLVDTGSPVHVLSPRAAALAPERLTKARVGRDYLGFTFPLFRAAGAAAQLAELGPLPGELFISEWADGTARVGGRALPDEPRFDGVVSPAWLAGDDEVVVLDFPKTRLWIGSPQQAQARLDQAELALTRSFVAMGPDLKAEVPVRVGGRTAMLALDTGAPQSLVYLPRGDDLPASAARTSEREVKLRVGEVEATAKATWAEQAAELPEGGLLGMDVLRSCILALNRQRFAVRCFAASGATRVPEQALQPGLDSPAVQGRGPASRGFVHTGPHGPRLRTRADGGYDWTGDDIAVRIHPDGSMTLERVASSRGGTIRMRFDDRDERQWFADETLALRTALAVAWDREMILAALGELPRRLRAILNDRRRPLSERRRILFELWDEAAEPDDTERGWAGARSRRLIETFIRNRLPVEGMDAYSAEELAAFNRSRQRGPRFDPYHPPPPEDYGEDVGSR
jgi:hypothetical protein